MRFFVIPAAVLTIAIPAMAAASVTFHNDVLPVLQKKCQECHRPGEAAPMSFLDYKSTRPWAKAIKTAMLSRKMPPWPADPHFGSFSNDRSLTEAELNTLVAWADTGALEGNSKDAPAPVKWVEGWTIGAPDAVVEMPQAFDVPASGTIDYQYVVIPTGFTEDRWVQLAEVRPGDRGVVHHVIAFIRPKGAKWLAGAAPGVPFVPGRGSRQAEGGSMLGTELLVGYAPGMPATICRDGSAKLLPAGADIVFQLHYTANGKAASDKTKIGLVFSKEPPQFRDVTMSAANNRFAIPAGDPNYEVHSQATLQQDTELVALMPHMHLRGKDFVYKVVYPDGRTETVLNIPRYDFAWQLEYNLEEPLPMPKGTRIECTAHFDNSANNPANPNPNIVVRWGDQSWDEMMIGWFDVIIPASADPAKLLLRVGAGE
ncbi:MAG TPA: cytochrome c [Bryobacteraceae bacterium]|nr:cytochrome c [Bryobacteraceae bacterium]